MSSHWYQKNLCFIGQDLAASGEKQYATGATNLLPANSKLSMFNVEVPGFYGTDGQDEKQFCVPDTDLL